MASVLCSIFLFLMLPCCCVLAQTTINLGQTLTAGDPKASPWLSPNQDFAFGFQQLDDNQDLFVLAIWFHKIPYQNIVWYPKKTNPAPRGSKVELTANRGFVLHDPKAAVELWKSGVGDAQTATAGFLNDLGNLVIQNKSSEHLWESFENPSDTVLPGQVLRKGETFLSSRRSETNFSLGKYQLRLIPDGNLVLNTINIPTGFTYDAYFWSGTVDTVNVSNSGKLMVFNESGSLYVLRENNMIELLSNVAYLSAAENYLRATLAFDGVFTVYYFPKNSTGNGNWSALWTKPDNICTAIGGGVGTGPCGYNSVCSISNDRPLCRCPPKFSLLDESDQYGGCKQDDPISCESADMMRNPEEVYDFVTLINTDWPSSDYEQLTPTNMEDCRKSCLEDCMCSVAILRGQSCWKKKLPLSNGRESLADVGRGRAFIKVRRNPSSPTPPGLPFPGEGKNQDSLVIVISALLGSSALVNLLFLFVICMGIFFLYNKKLPSFYHGDSIGESNLKCFAYTELVEATDGYKEELGRGSFGIVYKGEILHGGSKIPIAVKKLDRIVEDNEKEFRAEVNAIGQTHHKNLVRLLGFCNEGEQRLLVYEFLSNGTLASLLFGDLKPSWDQRTQVALGIGRGLVYLHEECSTQVIHCDIKPQNILLDEYYNARIADFGLAKLLMLNQSQTHTAIRGTKGYVAPEWFRNKAITAKVDVYSFGVMLLEIVCCRRNVEVEIEGQEKVILSDWAYDCYWRGMLEVLVEDDEEVLSDMKKLERFVMIAIWCIQEDPSLRPTMKKVMLMLEGIVQVSVPPCPCPYGMSN